MTPTKQLSAIIEIMQSAVFPWKCCGCQTLTQQAICENCLEKLSRKEGKCIACELPNILGMTHSGCRRPWLPTGVFTPFYYRGNNLDKIIIAGKYHFLPQVFFLLGNEVVKWIKTQKLEERLQAAIIVPMPLARQRKLWRGFNQSEILAKVIAEGLGLKIQPYLTRSKTRDNQKDLSKLARQKNMRGVFYLKNKTKPWHEFLITRSDSKQQNTPQNKTILLVDDVVTTGATMREAAKVLMRAGAKEVFGMAISRD